MMMSRYAQLASAGPRPAETRARITMRPKPEPTLRKAAESDLKVGLICADRDGNRIRIDRISIERGVGTVCYHFLNDELRVQEGVQERSIQQFLSEAWYKTGAQTRP